MRQAPAIIRLNDDEVKALADWSRRGKKEHRLVERAWIILLAHEGKTNQQIADQLHTRAARVSKWRQRFGRHRRAGWSDAARPASLLSTMKAPHSECWLYWMNRPQRAIPNGTAVAWQSDWGGEQRSGLADSAPS